MTLAVKIIPGGPLETNTYLVADDETKDAIVIDAAPDVTGTVAQMVAQAGYRVDAIVLTHGHWDHLVDTKDSTMRSAHQSSPVPASSTALPTRAPMLRFPTLRLRSIARWKLATS